MPTVVCAHREIVYAIITRHLDDFRDFSRQMMQAITIPDNNPET